MDRCCDVSKYCLRFKLSKAESLAHLERYQEAQEIAKFVIIHSFIPLEFNSVDPFEIFNNTESVSTMNKTPTL